MVPYVEKVAPTFFVEGRIDIPCDVTSAHVLIQKEIEESLAIGDIDENMPFKSASKGDYLYMDLIDKYITEMEDQGCTKLACIDREMFYIHSLKEIYHELPIWNEDKKFE